MTDTLKYIEGRMDEDEFYTTILVNAGKSLLLILAIFGASWIIYNMILPSTTSGTLGFVALTVLITCFAFYYVFKPKTLMDKVLWMAFAAFYAVIMYLGGQFIVVAILFLGLYVAITAVVGEISFTGIFTYRDLRKWVERETRLESPSPETQEPHNTQNEFA